MSLLASLLFHLPQGHTRQLSYSTGLTGVEWTVSISNAIPITWFDLDVRY